MTNGTSRATTAPIQAPAPVVPEDKKFFLAVPHSGSGGSGHDSTESPDSFGTGSTDSRRRDTARGSPLIELRNSYPRPQASPHREEELSSSFSASSPAGRAPSITSSKGGGGGALRLKTRATFTVSGGSGKRKGSSRKSAKDLYKREIEKRLSSTEHGAVDEIGSKGKGKEKLVGSTERNDVTPASPPALSRTSTTTAPVPRVKTLHQLPLGRLNHNAQHQINYRQLPSNPPRRPTSPSQLNGERPNGATAGLLRANQQHSSQLVGQSASGHLPTVPPKSGRPVEIAESSSDYSTTDTEEDSWESDSGSVEAKREEPPNGQPSKSRRLDVSKSERLRHSSNNNNRQRDPGESVHDAAVEVQRQLEMFQKLPSRAYSTLSQLPRTKSGLSLLFRPDPDLFPVGHPYRTSRSSQDLLARNWSVPAPPLAMTAVQKRSSPVAPVKADITASSVTSKEMDETSIDPNRPHNVIQAQRNGGKYRPRAKPADQEEEWDSDDPEDNPIPESVAERRLAALMKRGSRSKANSSSALPKEQETSRTHTEDQAQVENTQAIPRTTTMPVFPHQFLPEPAPLELPHEIRRRIISRELDEELRRNLLWERSQNQIPGRPARLNGSILPGPWKSLTPINGPASEERQSSQPATESKVQAHAQSNEKSSSHLFATQRTKSWAGEYHATGCKLKYIILRQRPHLITHCL